MAETKRSTRVINGIAAGVVCAVMIVAAVWIYQSSTAAVAAHDRMLAASSQVSLELGQSSLEDQHIEVVAAQAASVTVNHATVAAAEKAAAEKIAAAKALAAKAAAAKLAAEQAAAQTTQVQAAATPSDTTPPVATKCPAGSTANSGTTVNGVAVDTSCFPDICFHITLPDPAHPECVTAFKP